MESAGLNSKYISSEVRPSQTKKKSQAKSDKKSQAKQPSFTNAARQRLTNLSSLIFLIFYCVANQTNATVPSQSDVPFYQQSIKLNFKEGILKKKKENRKKKPSPISLSRMTTTIRAEAARSEWGWRERSRARTRSRMGEHRPRGRAWFWIWNGGRVWPWFWSGTGRTSPTLKVVKDGLVLAWPWIQGRHGGYLIRS